MYNACDFIHNAVLEVTQLTLEAIREQLTELNFNAENIRMITVEAMDDALLESCTTKEDESFFAKRGKLLFIVNGKEIQLNQGEFLNIEKGERHTWRNVSDEDTELIITFAPAGIENMFMELENDMTKIKEVGVKYGTDFEL